MTGARSVQHDREVAIVLIVAMAIATRPAPMRAAPPPADPKVSGIEVKFDDRQLKTDLSTKIAALVLDQLQGDDPYCRAAALLVAKSAAANYSYWTNLINFLRQTVKGIELGATIGGQKTVSKVAQVAGTIVDAFDSDDPAAALGQGLINEAVGWGVGKAKTGNDTADDAIKQGGEAAKKKLIGWLFPGTIGKGGSYSTTVGNCSVTIDIQFQWPGPEKGQVGGMRVFISGDCGCPKALSLNSGLVPTDFGGQTDGIKSCALGRFRLILFVPMTSLETRVDFSGNAVDITSLVKNGAKLKKSVEDAIAGKESDKDSKENAKDIVEEIGGKVSKATTVTATLILKPVFGKAVIEELRASCGKCDDPITDGGTGGGTGTGGGINDGGKPKPPIEETICEQKCGALRRAWEREQKEADELQEKLDYWKNAAAKATADAAALKPEIEAAQKKADDAARNVAIYEDFIRSIGDNATPQNKKELELKRAGARDAQAKAGSAKYKATLLLQEAAKFQRNMEFYEPLAKEAAARAAAAKQKYYECARSCWEAALLGNPKATVPQDVQKYINEHPKQTSMGTVPTATYANVSFEANAFTFPTDTPPACDETSSAVCTAPVSCTDNSCLNVTEYCTADPVACGGNSVSTGGGFQLMISSRSASAARRDGNDDNWAALESGMVVRFVSYVQPAARADARRLVSIISTGGSTGESFQVEVLDPSGRTKRIAMPEGVVLEPVRPGPKPKAGPAARNTSVQPIGAFCLDFAKLPPSPGMLYRIAGGATQRQFGSIRQVLNAAQDLTNRGLLHPDSNPRAYADAIKQFAVWTSREHWDLEKFSTAFLERTRKNLEELKQRWTPETEAVVKRTIPGRWADIQAVLKQAAVQ